MRLQSEKKLQIQQKSRQRLTTANVDEAVFKLNEIKKNFNEIIFIGCADENLK